MKRSQLYSQLPSDILSRDSISHYLVAVLQKRVTEEPAAVREVILSSCLT